MLNIDCVSLHLKRSKCSTLKQCTVHAEIKKYKLKVVSVEKIKFTGEKSKMNI